MPLLLLPQTVSCNNALREGLRLCVKKNESPIFVMLMSSLSTETDRSVLTQLSSVYAAADAAQLTSRVFVLCTNLRGPKNSRIPDFSKLLPEQPLQVVCSSAVSDLQIQTLKLPQDVSVEEFEETQEVINTSSSQVPLCNFSSVCLGGTFDGLHAGHKILLSEAALLATSRLVIGIAKDNLLVKKSLKELIPAVEDRVGLVMEFLSLIFCTDLVGEKAVVPETFEKSGVSEGPSRFLRLSSELRAEMYEIGDAAGPAGTDTELDAIVVSQETVRGGEVINGLRSARGLPPLKVHVINGGQLLQDPRADERLEEAKVSSSSLRARRLGEFLGRGDRGGRNWWSEKLQDSDVSPFVIGLTGGSGSGKSTVARRLQESHGVYVVDCDKLGQNAYATPGSPCWRDLVEHFGAEEILEDSSDAEAGIDARRIDRRKLGGIVFAEGGKQLGKLNSIVWPHIERLCLEEIRQEIQRVKKDCQKKHLVRIFVLDAAVLLEAGWKCDECWVAFVAPEEQVRRIVERDSKTAAEAEARLSTQMSTEKRLEAADVALSTAWAPEVTAEMVDKAYEKLEMRVKFGSGNGEVGIVVKGGKKNIESAEVGEEEYWVKN